MNRIIPAAIAIGAFLVSLEVGLAQQPPAVFIKATSVADLRTWDGYVTARERAGELQVLSAERDPSLPDRVVERLQQYHQGVPVWGAQVVRDSTDGVAESIFGDVSLPLTISTEPRLSMSDAQRVLTGDSGFLLRQPQLTVLSLESGDPRLAYTGVQSSDTGVFRIFIDAQTGAELLRYSEIETQSAIGTGRGAIGDRKKVSVTQQGGAYVADDKMRPPKLTTYDMRGDLPRAFQVVDQGAPLFASDIASDSDNDWTDPPTVDAHAYVGLTYDYYFKRHGRRGLDDRDRPLVAMVNGTRQQDWASTPPQLLGLFVLNAFWCGACGPGNVGVMYFGNGAGPQGFIVNGVQQTIGYFSGSIDIVAHELTHGVTQSSSGLIYLNESGALNESFSDIMGASVEFFHQPVGSGLGQADYLLGEDTFRGGLNGNRSMENPALFGDPDHYSKRFTGTTDNGGVHTNSGISNHVFYLAIEGGTNRTSGLAVQGVGAANREQIEKVFYRAFVFLLPANATFSNARGTTIQAARDLYGAGSAPERAVTQAWTAVGVN